MRVLLLPLSQSAARCPRGQVGSYVEWWRVCMRDYVEMGDWDGLVAAWEDFVLSGNNTVLWWFLWAIGCLSWAVAWLWYSAFHVLNAPGAIMASIPMSMDWMYYTWRMNSLNGLWRRVDHLQPFVDQSIIQAFRSRRRSLHLLNSKDAHVSYDVWKKKKKRAGKKS